MCVHIYEREGAQFFPVKYIIILKITYNSFLLNRNQFSELNVDIYVKGEKNHLKLHWGVEFLGCVCCKIYCVYLIDVIYWY